MVKLLSTPFVPALALFLLAVSPAHAEDTIVRVLFRDGPVAGAPIEIVDVRSGIAVATGKTDRRGNARITGLQQEGFYEAQTPNGRFVSQAFERYSSPVLHIVDERGPLLGAAVSGAFQVGEVRSGVDFVELDPPGASEAPDLDSGKGSVTGGAIRGRIFGPELTGMKLVLFLEGGVEVGNDHGKTPRTTFGNITQDEKVEWERDLAWDIGGGIAMPIPIPELRAWGEIKFAFHREELDFDYESTFNAGQGGARVLEQNVDDIDSFLFGVQLPVEVWRRGAVSALLEMGMTARIPSGGHDAEVRLGVESNTNQRVHSFDPKNSVTGHIGLRVQYAYSLLPSLTE